jgi:putative CocE/NonD family hydrolase
MKPFLSLISASSLFLSTVVGWAQSEPEAPPKYPEFPSETPSSFIVSTNSYDYIRREVMIPMRDQVKLHTVILIPKGAQKAPILLTRTPYDATELTSHSQSSHLGPILTGYDNATEVILEGGYIRVVQDVRGKHGSEGDYVMNRPLHGPLNPTPVDHSTDTYDTVEWLVNNIPESNGKVGILGISYDGFLPLMALINPHPALKVSVPMNPMVDGWMGDDWFHNGAFRQQNLAYIYDQQATRKSETKWWTSHFDDYDMFMEAVSAGELGRRRGMEQLGFWRKILEHPAYDAFWQQQAMDKILGAQPLTIPVLLVHSLWDQEDIYGDLAVYRAIKPKDTANDRVFLVLGPWHHGQEINDGSSLGALKFGSDTGLYFRRNILRPFLDQYLKDGAPPSGLPPVVAFETGNNIWRNLPAWPAPYRKDSSLKPTPLYLNSGGKLGFTSPGTAGEPFTEYVSDPARPVPFRARPIQPVGYDKGLTWPQWLVDDQREASGRTDVAVFVTEPLELPVRITGQPVANLVASTSGSDSDWVVKLIDVYPDEVAAQPMMGGYQLMIAGDILRGRYRESFATPKALTPNQPLSYRLPLPAANHVFLPKHRIMVQVQSSWFPLYDRNPQKFVPSIFWAQPGDYQKATQRIYHSTAHSSSIELPLVVDP